MEWALIGGGSCCCLLVVVLAIVGAIFMLKKKGGDDEDDKPRGGVFEPTLDDVSHDDETIQASTLGNEPWTRELADAPPPVPAEPPPPPPPEGINSIQIPDLPEDEAQRTILIQRPMKKLDDDYE